MAETRIFRFVIRDLDGNEIDGFSFGEVGSVTTAPRVVSRDGFGKFSIDTKVSEGDVVDRIIRQTVKRDPVTIPIAFVGARALDSCESFRSWVATYMDGKKYRATLEVTTAQRNASSGRVRRIDIAFQRFEPKAKAGGTVRANLTVLPLSLPYSEEIRRTVIAISVATLQYPYAYPFAYGGGDYGGTGTITNSYKDPIPLIVVFHGHISEPEASLLDESGNAYATIRFPGMDLAAGASLKVDAVNGRIIHTSPAGVETDYYNEIDKTADTFLYARNGTSTFSPNLDQTDQSKPSVDVTIVRYGL